MINNQRPVHPGEVLREEYLKPTNMTPFSLSRALKVSAATTNDIALCRRNVTVEVALRLARFFGGSPKFWLNLQQNYELKMAEQGLIQRVEQEVQPRFTLKS
jgi:addiction module HigA family antidote